MPAKVTTRLGVSLCGLAIDFGFAECIPLHALAEIPSPVGRQSCVGAAVTIPDLNVEGDSTSVDPGATL